MTANSYKLQMLWNGFLLNLTETTIRFKQKMLFLAPLNDRTLFIFIQGQCFVAIDPNAFEDGFTERMSELMSYCRNLEPVRNNLYTLRKHAHATIYRDFLTCKK